MAPLPRTLENTLPERSHALLWVIAAIGVAMAPHLFNQPLWVVLITALALIWRGGVHLGRLPMPSRWILVLLTVLMTGLVLGRYGTLFGRDAGVALLVLMTGLKLLETRTYRDAMVGVFLGYFVIITNFFYSQEIPVALYMLVAVFATTAALVRLNAGEGVQPARESFGLAGLMLGQAVPVMIILFLLFPRLPGPLWGAPQDSTAGVTGLSDSMSPGAISELLQSDAPAFRVSFVHDPPPPAERYWRGPVFWQFDGSTWRRGRDMGTTAPPLILEPTNLVTHTINLEPHQQRWLLALDVPVSVPPDARMTEDQYLVAGQPVRRLIQYTVDALPDGVLEPELTPERRQQALALPDQAAPRTQAMARKWRDQKDDDDVLIQAVLDHFHQEAFFYTLSPPPMSREPVDQFLFEARAGFCEHYASAFVVLMRAAGIPARVVTGYQGGEYNRLGNYLLVRQSDAHAWAEVWLEGRGWVRVDPTAAVAPERIESGIRTALAGDQAAPDFIRRGPGWGMARLQWALWRDSIDYYWSGWVLAFGPERQEELLERLGLGRLDWRGMVTLMVVLVGTVVLVFTAAFLWRNRPPKADPLAAIYGHFCRRLARVGLIRAPHEPPLDFGRRIARERPDLAEPVLDFIQAYVALRYGPAPDLTQYRQLQGRLRRIKP
ncbi:protein of unknown function [Ectothiorhodospira magna]|uniref:Transglutaminase-like domain-containing protein n=1 Tax=Ectothiorhodospira magna TaxID=867345 RepID=A0A1H8YXN4_9GAMM|nr:DUF3488 and transglutaminase-like domain-containing protein [Ectothiorhodospira magna]SEP56846.1 protein of unknown function [Ectothiorhodospira magna]